jgi:elongation factor P
MYSISDLKVGTVITWNNGPYQIIRAEHSKQARSAAVLRVKMRHLVTGQVLEQTFQQNDSISPADLERRAANFQYQDEEGLVFMDNETFDQFTLGGEAVLDTVNYVKEGQDVEVLFYEGKPVSVFLPPKVELRVVEAPPNVKGDSSGSVTKRVKLETGYEVTVPVFINQDEILRINTQTGEYVERVNK